MRVCAPTITHALGCSPIPAGSLAVAPPDGAFCG